MIENYKASIPKITHQIAELITSGDLQGLKYHLNVFFDSPIFYIFETLIAIRNLCTSHPQQINSLFYFNNKERTPLMLASELGLPGDSLLYHLCLFN